MCQAFRALLGRCPRLRVDCPLTLPHLPSPLPHLPSPLPHLPSPLPHLPSPFPLSSLPLFPSSFAYGVCGATTSRKQFGYIDGDFLEWQFRILGRFKNPVASVDRNISGFAREIFTDAGNYAIHFLQPVEADDTTSLTAEPGTGTRPTRLWHARAHRPRSTSSKASTPLIVCSVAAAMANARREYLSIAERAVVMACSVAIDFDYFSRHSGVGYVIRSHPLDV